jgi:hypothetical protein
LILIYSLKKFLSLKDYVYPTNPGNLAGVTAGNPGGWTKSPLGYYLIGTNSINANVISSAFSASLTTCMTTCQQTAYCIYVTYTTSYSNCWLLRNYLSQATTINETAYSLGIIVQNPLITNKYY